MNQSQQLFGEPAERPRNKVRAFMLPWIQAFIQHSPFLVMATSNAQGKCDASPKGGKPGFVKVLDERHLLIPDIAGNKLFQSYENIESNAQLGLVFFIPAIDASARVNGRVRVLRQGDAEFEHLSLEVFDADEKAILLQALLLEVEESYSHCPRALKFSQLWDEQTITQNRENPPIEKWVAGT
jgi:uncharacterized protein